jgi:hypothetical protein
VEHLSVSTLPVLGLTLAWKICTYKHSSLVCFGISDEEKSFKTLTTGVNNKKLFSSLIMEQNKLERFCPY